MIKFNKINIIIFISICFNVFLSLPFIFLNVLKKKEVSFLIALLLAILGFYFIPQDSNFDIYRYYEVFYDPIKRLSLFSHQRDIYAENLVKLILFTKMLPNLLPFTSAFITYYFLFKSFFMTGNKKIKPIYYLILFLISYIHIPIIGYTGIRFYPATAIFCYGVLNKNKRKKIIFPILSILIHSSLILPTAVYFIFEYIIRIKIKHKKVFILISLMLGILLTPQVAIHIVRWVNGFKIVHVSEGYIFGKWGIEYQGSKNTALSLLGFYLDYFFRIGIIVLYHFLSGDKRNDYIFILSSFSLIFYRYYVIFERYSGLLVILIFYVTQDKYFIKKNKANIIGIFIFFSAFYHLLFDLRKFYPSFILSYGSPLKLSLINLIMDIF